MNKKKVLSLALSFAMVLSSTVALAAENDAYVYNKDGSLFATANQMNAFKALGNQVNGQQGNFLFSLDGKLYKMTDAFQAFADADNDLEAFHNKLIENEPVIVDEDAEELEVIEISAITKTVTLDVTVFEAEEDAKVNVEIFKLNKDGEKTTPSALKLTNLEIKEDKVVVDASTKTFGDADYAIVVKIGTVEEEVVATIEFDAVEKLVTNINKATAAQLATLLNNEAYFTGFDIAKVDAYYTAKGAVATYKTIAEVQEKVIDAGEVASGFTAFVKEIDEIDGVFAKYTFFKETFKYVDDANMDAYMDKSPGPIFDASQKINVTGGVNSFEKVQDEIDQINLDAVVDKFDASVKTIAAATKPSKLQEAKSALEALDLVDAKTKSKVVGTTVNTKTKAEIVDAIDAQLDKIADERDKADKEIVKAQAAIDAFVVANGEVPTAAHTQYDALVVAIEALEKEDLSETELALTTITPAITALEGKTEELTIVGDAIVALAAFESAYKGGKDVTGAKADAKYTAVTTLLDLTDTDNPKFATSKGVSDLKPVLVALKAETAEWVLYNDVMAAETAEELSSLLFGFKVNDYTNLKAAQKLEVAAMVLEALDADTHKNHANVKTLLGDNSSTTIQAYKALLTGVNSATDNTTMITALEAIETAKFVEGFKDLDTQAQADIAEALLEGAPYTTIAEIIAAMGL